MKAILADHGYPGTSRVETKFVPAVPPTFYASGKKKGQTRYEGSPAYVELVLRDMNLKIIGQARVLRDELVRALSL